jgi:hypothetical protein
MSIRSSHACSAGLLSRAWPENVRKITGENWLRVLEQAKAV